MVLPVEYYRTLRSLVPERNSKMASAERKMLGLTLVRLRR